jgi:DnaK suppressor protein
VPTPVEASKPVKSAAKVKPLLQAKAPEPAVKTVPDTADKPVKQTPAKAKAAVEPAAPQPFPVVPQDQKWEEIRLILEKLKDDTLREIRKSVKNGTEAVAAIEPGGDIYDQASSERDRELGLLLGDREREKIHSIDEALLRIVEGDYGICEECDEDIPLGRLKAMPFTRHCVKCKSDLEKLQAQTKRVEEERAYREIPLGAEEEE